MWPGQSNRPGYPQGAGRPPVDQRASYYRQSGYFQQPDSFHQVPQPRPNMHQHQPSPQQQTQSPNPPHPNPSMYMHASRPAPPNHQSSAAFSPMSRPMPGSAQRPPVSYMMTNAQPDQGHYGRSSLGRSKSLSRPERQRPRQGMIHRSPSQHRAMLQQQQQQMLMQQQQRRSMAHIVRSRPMSNRLQSETQHRRQPTPRGGPPDPPPPSGPTAAPVEDDSGFLSKIWPWTAFIATCCFPNYIIRVCFRKSNPMMQQAWREKVTLVYIILLLCGSLAFVTYGLTRVLCPEDVQNNPYSTVLNGVRVPMWREDVLVYGKIYPFSSMQNFFASQNLNLSTDFQNMDISGIFNSDTRNYCTQWDNGTNATLGSCQVKSPYGSTLVTKDGKCLSLTALQKAIPSSVYLGFDWDDLSTRGDPALYNNQLALVGDYVLNLTNYFLANDKFFGNNVDTALRNNLGNDASYALLYSSAGKNARNCLIARYSVGIMETETGGCIASQMIMTIMLIVIIAMIIVRYSMAVIFQWFIARRLVKPGGRSNWLAWRSIKGGNNERSNHMPGPYNNYPNMASAGGSSASLGSGGSSRATPVSEQSSTAAMEQANKPQDIVDANLYTVMLVTCYSEGEQGLRTTMDSLAETTYSKKHKIFFVIADGMVTGQGETRPTPDIVRDMMDLDRSTNESPEHSMSNPKKCSYQAIADGENQLNVAQVYAGHYKGVPCILIAKCGTEEEASRAKPGNRGKRDSQLILMGFFQRVLFNERLSELDYEIFWKMSNLMRGVSPDKFELVLMVDADTKVLPDAVTYMVAAMANDITIMGLCGETRIANKKESWVTAIQVFEYYISHHYAKAFESLFGIVTCLPGCFSMYRIKSPKNGAWVPILASPEIVNEYNENVVTTLHEKNLLLLGEDRFLSTLMLRAFPKRQMMFVPQARCKTVVPDRFRVLLSQRRRWINSTVHNLMELVLVSDLCGIACLSMQFSVFVDLIGTMVLPAAICMTVVLIVTCAISSNPQWQSLALLIAILGLPAVLIALTSRKWIYIMWMGVYICALPIWNLVLPVYSFWHFDDFSWGATRLVAGEKKGQAHDASEGIFDSSRLVMKKWEEWEFQRTKRRPLSTKPPLTPNTPASMDGRHSVNSQTFSNIFNDRRQFTATPSPPTPDRRS